MESGIYTVKSSDLSPIMEALSSNASVIVPWGIGIIAFFAGIKFVPKLIKMWTKG